MADEAWVQALRGIDLFADLPADAQRRVAEEMKEYRYSAGDVIVQQGQGGQHGRMFVLLEGTADADVDGAVVSTYQGGEHFGEMSLLDGGPRSATVTATSDVVLAGLVSWNLRSVLVEEPSIAMHLIEVLAGRLRKANAQVDD